MLRLPFLMALVILCNTAFAQGIGTILFVSEEDCAITIDAEKRHLVEASSPLKLELSAGTHVVQVHCQINAAGNAAMKIIELSAGESLVLPVHAGNEPNSVAEPSEMVRLINAELTLTGGLTAALQDQHTEDYYSTGAPIFHYYLQRGDRVKVNVRKTEQKGTHAIVFGRFEDGTTLFSLNSFTELTDEWIDITSDGVYYLSFGTNYAFDRTIALSVDRFLNPLNSEPLDSRVELRYAYEPVVVMEPSKFLINGSANANLAGGQNEIPVPVHLPQNTVEWYYTYTSSEDAAATESALRNFSLVEGITTALSSSIIVGEGLSAIFEMIKEPPGTDHCSVTLLDYENFELSRAGQTYSLYPDGSRTNMMSGKVRVPGVIPNGAYLVFKSLRTFHPLTIGVEIVAIKATPYYTSISAK